MWHCDQLEKFLNHATARFTRFRDPNDRSSIEVKRVTLTLDTATHPVPGQHYDFLKDTETGAESFIPYVPKPRTPAISAATSGAAQPDTSAPSQEDASSETSEAAADVASAAEPAQGEAVTH